MATLPAARAAAPNADAAAARAHDFFGLLSVERRPGIRGPRVARAPASDTCRRSATGSAGDIGFGAYLAFEALQLARCAQWQRGAASK